MEVETGECSIEAAFYSCFVAEDHVSFLDSWQRCSADMTAGVPTVMVINSFGDFRGLHAKGTTESPVRNGDSLDEHSFYHADGTELFGQVG